MLRGSGTSSIDLARALRAASFCLRLAALDALSVGIRGDRVSLCQESDTEPIQPGSVQRFGRCDRGAFQPALSRKLSRLRPTPCLPPALAGACARHLPPGPPSRTI